MLGSPQAGDVIIGTGGLRKLRFSDERRNKGKRGGTRIIYYWQSGGSQFWLFTLFSKDEMAVFAQYLRINKRTLENWEQGRVKPNAQAAVLIKMVEKYPDTLARLGSV